MVNDKPFLAILCIARNGLEGTFAKDQIYNIVLPFA
jgi:hypothetical protein